MMAAGAPLGTAECSAAALLLQKPSLIRVFEALDHGGDETRVVGGALRNALMDRPVHEIDIATTLEPGDVTARARAAGLRCIPTGLAHGTVTLIAKGETFEVTTLREDTETDGRRAKVRFGRDFRADALRRDFTINALYMDRKGRLYDYVGSLADIGERRVRFIGDPDQRIREDYLRVLRFFRFTADYSEWPIDRDGFLAALRQRAGLRLLSRERVRGELFKLLCARRADAVTQEMCEAGLLGPLLASAPDPARLHRLDAGSQAPRDPLLALAALCLRLPEDAGRLRERLRLSNAEFLRLERAAGVLLERHGRDRPPTIDELRMILFRCGRQAGLDGLALARAEAAGANGAQWDAAREFLIGAPEPRLPFTGDDLIARGVAEGHSIGKALDRLRERWVSSRFSDDATVLAAMLDEAANEAT